MKEQLQETILILYKVFFIGLLAQFFLHTFVTFELGLDTPFMSVIWLWKEILVVMLGILTLIGIIGTNGWKRHFGNKELTKFLIGLIITIGLTAFLHIYFNQGEIGAYILAFKYDFLGFIIFLVGAHSGLLLAQSQAKKLILWYGTVLKYCLLLALIRYFVIFVKPGTLKLFGYDNFVYEGLVGHAPPAAYYTQINRGLPRNQFLFERPITRGFFLTALRPLFYILYLHKKPLKETRLRWVIYALNIVVTFSRAARGTWIIQVVLIAFFMTKKFRKTLWQVGLPLLLVFGIISVLGFDQIMDRGYSNFGHITMIKNGIAMFLESPLRGVGAATAGPGSHRGGIPFNPENQFLQILIEFGIIGFIGWIMLYGRLTIVGIQRLVSTRKKDIYMLFALSMGMVGLSISGMVLHSFSDRMVVYPYMMLMGIVFAWTSVQSTIGEENELPKGKKKNKLKKID